MKPPRFAVAALVALAVPASVRWVRADDFALPKAQPAARYEPMAGRSPFTAPSVAPPTATPVPVAVGPRWWDQMTVTSLMEVGSTYFAAVVDRANNKRYLLESGKLDADSQLMLTEVQWNERGDQSTVTVRKGAEVAPPLRFDPTAASNPVGPQQPFNVPRGPTAFNTPTLPPNFNAPPPPPPSTSVVRRSGPIASRPAGQPNPRTTQPIPPNGSEIRKVRPLGGNSEADD